MSFEGALTPEALDQFREVQQLAYRCAEEVAAGLESGVSEREACARMKRYLVDAGVDDWFHVPFAWFGDRTAFRGRAFRTALGFLPTARRLEENMPYILDVAPVLRGATADIGYAGCIGANPVLDRIVDDLAEHRALILRLVQERRTFADIYREVDRLAARQGFDNRHRKYPGRVLAHEVRLLPERGRSAVIGTFGLRHLRSLGRSLREGRRAGWSPLWADGPRSEHPPHPGLWAVEPHLGFRDVGAKFEELLVVTEEGASWLDDDLPHVRRWASRSITAGAA